jgi:hypothetical protein
MEDNLELAPLKNYKFVNEKNIFNNSDKPTAAKTQNKSLNIIYENKSNSRIELN